jgi:hypothetical protein
MDDYLVPAETSNLGNFAATAERGPMDFAIAEELVGAPISPAIPFGTNIEPMVREEERRQELVLREQLAAPVPQTGMPAWLKGALIIGGLVAVVSYLRVRKVL